LLADIDISFSLPLAIDTHINIDIIIDIIAVSQAALAEASGPFSLTQASLSAVSFH